MNIMVGAFDYEIINDSLISPQAEKQDEGERPTVDDLFIDRDSPASP
jgi:hypothetical protein